MEGQPREIQLGDLMMYRQLARCLRRLPFVCIVRSRYQRYSSAVGRNFGAWRTRVACSKAYAMRMRTGSLHARPEKEIPTGRPRT